MTFVFYGNESWIEYKESEKCVTNRFFSDAWKQAFAKLKTLEKDQTDNKLDNKTLTLGTGLLGLTDEGKKNVSKHT